MSPSAATSRCTLCSNPDAARLLGRKCPRCDRVLGEPLDQRLVDADTNVVRADVRCVECGYNLRTLHVTALCPECGRLVLDSLTSNELGFSDLPWLRRVRSGLSLIVGAHLGLIVMVLGVAFLFNIARQLRWTPQATDDLVRTVLEAALILLAVGVWRMTTHDPEQPRTRDGQLLRWTTRILGLSPAVLVGPWPMGWFLVLPWPVGHARDDAVAGTLAWFAAVLAIALCLQFVTRLAARARQPRLRKAAITAMAVVVITGIGFEVALQAGPSGNNAVDLMLFTAMMVTYLLSLLVFVAGRRMLSSAIRRASQLEDCLSSPPVEDDETTFAEATP